MIRILAWAAAILVPVLLAGCARPAPNQIQARTDQYSPSVEVDSAYVQVDTGNLARHGWFLQSFVNRQTRAVSHRLFFEAVYPPPLEYFDSAFDDTAKPLPVVNLFRSRGCVSEGCTDEERVGILLDEAMLRERMGSGLTVKIASRHGEAYELAVGPDIIRTQLDKIAKVLGSAYVAGAPGADLSSPPLLGVHPIPLPADNAARIANPSLVGLLVVAVDRGLAAERAGIRVGDVITDYDGRPVATVEDLKAAILNGGRGRAIPVGVVRVGETRRVTVNVTL